jgi:hypothetical protein
MIFYFVLKFLELFKCFRFLSHKIDITITTKIIGEGYKVVKSTKQGIGPEYLLRCGGVDEGEGAARAAGHFG